MKFLIAVDGSEHTKRLLAWLAVHDEVLARGAEHTFITVVPPVPPHIQRQLPAAMVRGYCEDRAKEVLDPVLAFATQHGWRFDTRTPIGDPAREIAECAAQGRFDLLLMGSHGHSAMGSLFLGSVTQRVLASSKVPVLVVR